MDTSRYFIGVDTSHFLDDLLYIFRVVRNRFIARCRKRIGDLCMLVDMPHDAVLQYQASLELLRAIGDEFWVGGESAS